MLFHKLKQMIAKVKTYNKNFMKKYASYNNLNNKIKWLIEELSFFGPFVILNCNIQNKITCFYSKFMNEIQRRE